ncbi:MAG: type II toxin-antitoxin system RelE/ParE family toxin [Pseudolabrys sp.]|nr:type II toxin-antitoxin system RelE/ParE family toxin [Pseudolabrys sp.]
MIVRYTPRAFSDLDEIRTYIEKFNPDAARRVLSVIERVAARLGDFPEAGYQADELGVRVIYTVRYPYRIYYRIDSDTLSVLHIRHTARTPIARGDL